MSVSLTRDWRRGLGAAEASETLPVVVAALLVWSGASTKVSISRNGVFFVLWGSQPSPGGGVMGCTGPPVLLNPSRAWKPIGSFLRFPMEQLCSSGMSATAA